MVSRRIMDYPQVQSRLVDKRRELSAALLEASSARLTDATDIPSATVYGVVRAVLVDPRPGQPRGTGYT